MESIIYLVESYNVEFLLGLGLINIILILIFLITSKMNDNRITTYMEKIESTSNASLESEVEELRKKLEEAKEFQLDLKNNLTDVEGKLKTSIQKVGFIKYNAFECTENRLSFSIALLDERDNGFILTSIYTNGESISYAKGIINKVSKIKLSAEEMIALDRALNNVDSYN